MSNNKVCKVTYHVSCNLRSSNYCDLLILCEAQSPSAGSEAQRWPLRDVRHDRISK
jgi:hypothetical protein